MMRGDAALPTVAKILAAQQMYVLGGAAQLFFGACDIGIALIFYELLKPVSRSISLLAAFFRVAFVAIASANMFNHFAPLVLLTDTASLAAFKPAELRALAMDFLRLRTLGFDVALVFFGFHCMLAGYLLFRSTFFPRVLGALLAIGGVGYMINIFTNVVPAETRVHLFPYIMLPAGIAEISLSLWLIIVGVNVRNWQMRATSAANTSG
jgi:hypothetical protein